MLTADSRLFLSPTEVAAQVIDGEAIIINLASGLYYSMQGVGAVVWEGLVAGLSLEEVAVTVAARYGVTREHVRSDIERLARELVDEGLLQVSSEGPVKPVETAPSTPGPSPYEPPVLRVYRDMGDLLALDPPTPGLQNIAWEEQDQDRATG